MQATLPVTQPLRGQRGPDHLLTDELVHSVEGKAVNKASEVQRQMRNGSYWFDPIERRVLKATVRSFGTTCGSTGWDGEGSAPVLDLTLENALRFIDALPMGYAEPDPGVDPDGEISLSWIGKKGHRLSLSIGPTGRISYAYRIGPRRRNGTEWLGDSIPEDLLEYIGSFPVFG
ncbi:MAG: hypothetical protein K8H89_00540 [Flavobacteriales bacterium]|jgi:hypothetical protein|nr:hypothetical protein [Flavobacteriales bacterium]